MSPFNVDLPEAFDGQSIYWGEGHWLHVVNGAGLNPIWGFYDGGNRPVLAGATVITQGWWHKVTAINTRTRKPLWTCRAWRGAAHSLARTSAGKTLIVEAFNDPRVVAGIEVETGQIVWQHPLMMDGDYSTLSAISAGAGRRVFVPGWHEHLPGQTEPRGGFYCLDADTGKLQWQYEVAKTRGAVVIVSGGNVYGLDDHGFLYKFVP